MNPIWAFFFKDKYRTPLSVYKMSLAEMTVLGALAAGAGIGIFEGLKYIINLPALQ